MDTMQETLDELAAVCAKRLMQEGEPDSTEVRVVVRRHPEHGVAFDEWQAWAEVRDAAVRA